MPLQMQSEWPVLSAGLFSDVISWRKTHTVDARCFALDLGRWILSITINKRTILVYFSKKTKLIIWPLKQLSCAPLHTLSNSYDVPVGFVPLPLWNCVLLYLRSPKGVCCSISDDLSYSHGDIDCSLLQVCQRVIPATGCSQIRFSWRNAANPHVCHY